MISSLAALFKISPGGWTRRNITGTYGEWIGDMWGYELYIWIDRIGDSHLLTIGELSMIQQYMINDIQQPPEDSYFTQNILFDYGYVIFIPIRGPSLSTHPHLYQSESIKSNQSHKYTYECQQIGSSHYQYWWIFLRKIFANHRPSCGKEASTSTFPRWHSRDDPTRCRSAHHPRWSPGRRRHEGPLQPRTWSWPRRDFKRQQQQQQQQQSKLTQGET